VIDAEASAALRSDACDRAAERVSGTHFRRLDGAWLSSIGLDASVFADDEVALDRVLALGFNVIDLGVQALRGAGTLGARLAAAGDARRAMFVLARGGSLARYGTSMGPFMHRVGTELVEPGVIAWDDIADYACIAAPWLARDIALVREALGAPVDAYLLDRPDRLLRNRPPSEHATRITGAFEALERAVAEGAIGCYGIVFDLAAPEVTLERAFAAARDVAGTRHHLRIAWLPASFGALDPRDEQGSAAAYEAGKRAADLGGYVVTASSELRGIGDLPAHLRNELPACESAEDRIVQLCRSAPGVGTTFATVGDALGLEELGRIARLPTTTDAARYLLEV